MSTVLPPIADDYHTWGWEIGAEAGRRLVGENDDFIGITASSVEAPEALRIYGRAFLRACIRSYRAELQRRVTAREDRAADVRRSMRSSQPDAAEEKRSEP